jgi:hypothetical protein
VETGRLFGLYSLLMIVFACFNAESAGTLILQQVTVIREVLPIANQGLVVPRIVRGLHCANG